LANSPQLGAAQKGNFIELVQKLYNMVFFDMQNHRSKLGYLIVYITCWPIKVGFNGLPEHFNISHSKVIPNIIVRERVSCTLLLSNISNDKLRRV